jgi:predicted O-methyltransferase YrrM
MFTFSTSASKARRARQRERLAINWGGSRSTGGGAAADEAPPRAERIQTLIQRFADPAALLAALELDLFTHLGSGPRPVADLAAEIPADPDRLLVLLEALTLTGLVVKDEDGSFRSERDAAHFLDRSKHDYLAEIEGLRLRFETLLATARSIREDAPAMPAEVEGLADDVCAARVHAAHGEALAAGRALLESLGLAPEAGVLAPQSLLDLGGGSGGLAIAACQAVPELTATIVERPRMAEIAKLYVAHAGLAGRIEVRAGDLTADGPAAKVECVVLRLVLQCLAPRQAAIVIARAATMLEEGGCLHLVDWAAEDGGRGRDQAVRQNLLLLNSYQEGRVHAAGELEAWLQAAGLNEIQKRPAPLGAAGAGAVLISARKTPA